MKLGIMIVVSLGAHLGAGWVMARMPRDPTGPPATVVEMTIAEPPPPRPPPPPPEPAPAPPSQPAPARPRAAPRPRPVARATAPAGAASPTSVAVPAEPLDFTDEPASPIGGGPDPGPATPGPRGPARRASGSGTVALADLSRPPEPPALDDALARRYPPEARAEGRHGRAVVRVRIEPDGRAAVLIVVTASDPAFGTACRATVDGSRWRAPLDAAGKAVATEVSYTCSFEVAP